MKKDSFRNSFFVFVSGAFLFLCVLFLASCDNFLKGSNIRQDLAEAIEIANTQPTTFFVLIDEGSGTASAGQLRLKKKESFDIMFTPSSEWKFLYWEVVDRSTSEPVENIINFSNKNLPETKGTVIQTRENLALHPKCIKLPAVVSHTPAVETETNYANTPIILNFNMELDEENFAEGGVFEKYDFITLSCSGSPITNLFEKPVLSENKTSIMLMPKPDELAYYIKEEKKAAYIDVVVGFKDGISILAGGQSSPMGAGQSFSVRYNSTVETEPPTEVQFVVSRPDDKESHFDIRICPTDSLDSLDAELIRQNRAKGKIYIYGKYTDAGSGVKTVQVKEKRIMGTRGASVSGIEKKSEYTAQNATYISSGSITEFYIEHELQTETGLYQIDVTVFDACKNEAEVQSFSVVNVSSQNYYNSKGELFDVYNYPDRRGHWFNISRDFNMETYQKNIKKLFITPIIIPYGDDTDLTPLREVLLYSVINDYYDKFNITCTYKDKTGKIVQELFEYKEEIIPTVVDDEGTIEDEAYPYWCLELNVDKVSGLELEINVTDDLGVSIQNTTRFLPEPDVVIVEKDDKKVLDCFYDTFNSSYGWIYKKKNGDSISYYNAKDYPSFQMQDGYTYQVIPQNSYLLSEICDKEFSTTTPTTNPEPVIWEDGYPKLRKSEEQGKLIATIKVKNPEKYKNVYCDYQRGYSASYKQFLPSGESTMDLVIDTTDAYNYDLSFTLYNYDGNSLSTGTTKQIDKITDTSYDNIPPKATTIFNSAAINLQFETYILKLEDSISKVGTVELIKPDNSTLSLIDELDIGDPTVLIEIPMWMVNEYGTTIKYGDLSNNFKTQTFSLPSVAKVKIDSINHYSGSQSIGKWYLTGDFGSYSFRYYKLDTDTLEWNKVTTQQGVVISDLSGTSSLYLGENVFVKIEYFENEVFSVGIPQYFYFSQTGLNTGHFDYITPCTDNSVFVVSDAPTYVETIITTKPYNECKNWAQVEWEGFHRRESEVFYNFEKVENPTPRKYTIPLDKINSKECYVILAHFADGTSFMTEVREKP
ncbi:MAG: hypothetical protein J5726_00735 [Treponema sp.]|nr:hypothetical protein [Treponema sp.]